MPNLLGSETKALAAILIAGALVLLLVVAFELMDIKGSVRRIERDDRQLVIVVQRDLQSSHAAAQRVKLEAGAIPSP
jgi:hypothetical protein